MYSAKCRTASVIHKARFDRPIATSTKLRLKPLCYDHLFLRDQFTSTLNRIFIAQPTPTPHKY